MLPVAGSVQAVHLISSLEVCLLGRPKSQPEGHHALIGRAKLRRSKDRPVEYGQMYNEE